MNQKDLTHLIELAKYGEIANPYKNDDFTQF